MFHSSKAVHPYSCMSILEETGWGWDETAMNEILSWVNGKSCNAIHAPWTLKWLYSIDLCLFALDITPYKQSSGLHEVWIPPETIWHRDYLEFLEMQCFAIAIMEADQIAASEDIPDQSSFLSSKQCNGADEHCIQAGYTGIYNKKCTPHTQCIHMHKTNTLDWECALVENI